MKIALVERAASTSVVPLETSWDTLCRNLSQVKPGKKDGIAWIPAEIESGARRSDRVKALPTLVLDIENTKGVDPPDLDELKDRLVVLGFAAHVHTSYSHSPDSTRCRIVVPLDCPLQPSKLKGALQSLAEKLGLTDCWDTNCTDPARLFYTPRCPPGKEGDFKFFTTKGRFITETDLNIQRPRPRLTKLGAQFLQFPKRPETPENISRLKSQLACIDAGCERNIWRDIVWSVLSTGWNCAEKLALEWSLTAPDLFEQDAFDKIVASFDPEKACTLRTLHYHAVKAGWTPDAVPLLPQSRYTFRTIDQLAALPPQEWRVKGLFPANGIASIYGPSGSGKSFLAMDLLAKIGRGDDFYGHKTKSCPVVYVALEGVSGITKRLQAYEKHHNIKIPDTFRVVTERFSLFNTDVVSFADSVKTEMLEGGVIVIDTLAQSAPQADENASADMGTIILNAQRLQHLTNSLVVLIHHTGKDATKGARGHSSLMAALDAAIEVRKSVTGREWVIAKCKDDIDGVIHPLKLEQVNLGVDTDGDSITSCVALPDIFRANTPPPPSGKNQQAMLAAIKRKWPSSSVVQMTDLTELAKTTLTCQRRELRGKEAVETLAELGHLTEQAGGYLVK